MKFFITSTMLILCQLLFFSQLEIVSQDVIVKWDFEETTETPASEFPWDFVVVDEDQTESVWAEYEGPSGPSTWILIDEPNNENVDNLVAAATSWHSPLGIASNWLITPAINLSEYDHTALSLRYKLQQVDWPDGFRILVSTSGQNVEDFTNVIFEIGSGCYNTEESVEMAPFWDCNCNPECPENWEENWQTIFASLEAYAGQEIFIAVHHNANDQVGIVIDDLTIFEVECSLALELETFANTNTLALTSGASGSIHATWVNQDTGEVLESTELFQADLSNGNWQVTVEDGAGCSVSETFSVEGAGNNALLNDFCEGALDFNLFFPSEIGEFTNTPILNNFEATSGEEAISDFNCFNSSNVEYTTWFTFIGNGGNFRVSIRDDDSNLSVAIDDIAWGVYTGNCSNLTPALCSSQSELVLETIDGQEYHFFISGMNNQFSIRTLRVPSCADITPGTYTINEHVCHNGWMSGQVLSSPIIPETNGEDGFTWAISTAPLSTEIQNPETDPSFLAYIIAFESAPFNATLINDGDPAAYGTYYLTPIIYGNCALSGGIPDLDTGCVRFGESLESNLYGPSEPIDGSLTFNEKAHTVSADLTGGSGNFQYAWSDGSDTPSIEVEDTGTYSLLIEDISGCFSDLTLTIDIVISGLDDERQIEFSIFPNPTNNQLHFDCSASGYGIEQYQITNLDGKVWASGILNSPNCQGSMSVGHLPPGIYILNINTVDQSVIQERFMVSN